MANKDTSIITVRVDKKTKKRLEELADSEAINFSTSINRIFLKHIQWTKFAKELEFMSLDPDILDALFEDVNDEKLKNLTKIGKKRFSNMCEYIHGEVNYDKFIVTMDTWLSESNLNFRHLLVGNSDKYIINHNFRKSFSKFLLDVFTQCVSDFGYTTTDIFCEKERLSFSIVQTKKCTS